MSVGETLRRERVRRNLDLKQVSDELKISTRFLQAMEAGEFDKLPGGVFAKAFVRQYAQLLGLDGEELAGEVQRQIEPGPAAPAVVDSAKIESVPISVPRVQEWEHVGDGRSFWSTWSSTITALGTVVVVMLICSAVYAYWQRPHRSAPESVAAAPAPAQKPQASQAVAPPAEKPPAAAEPAGQSAMVTPAADATSTAAAAPEAATPGPRGPVHVELDFHSDVWVRAEADGKVVFIGTMAAGQTRTIDAENAVLLRLGNAGGVTIKLNDKQLDPVGPAGQIRTVQLTSGGFQIVAPPKPSEPVDPLGRLWRSNDFWRLRSITSNS